VGAISYPAASLWPYKLTLSILSKAIFRGLKFQTHTPVTAIESDSAGWKLITSTGEIRTQKVIHATNGYSSYLLPELTGRLVPLKGHVAAIPPSTSFAASPLHNTSAFVWDTDYDYLIQRQVGGKELILGGRDSSHPEGSGGPLGDSDDSCISEEFANRLKAFPKENFEGWGEDPESLQDARVWSGIMGVTNDSLPFLGELPEKKGQYIAAGYNGHGTLKMVFLHCQVTDWNYRNGPYLFVSESVLPVSARGRDR
jgi:glycine/D-amino acid oxidase-like deaminating enzyme